MPSRNKISGVHGCFSSHRDPLPCRHTVTARGSEVSVSGGVHVSKTETIIRKIEDCTSLLRGYSWTTVHWRIHLQQPSHLHLSNQSCEWAQADSGWVWGLMRRGQMKSAENSDVPISGCGLTLRSKLAIFSLSLPQYTAATGNLLAKISTLSWVKH